MGVIFDGLKDNNLLNAYHTYHANSVEMPKNTGHGPELDPHARTHLKQLNICIEPVR